jgi:pimeloyl-ACP methyl ester carboxylesterase
VKFCLQLFLCSSLVLSGLLSQRAQTLAVDTGNTLDVGSFQKTGAETLKPSNSSPRITSDRLHSSSQFATVDGTRLHFLIEGTGSPVVLIHGNPGSAKDWTRLFDPLAVRHKIVAFDRPGHGQSQRPRHGDTTVEVQASLLHDALKQFHIVRPIIVGHSWGGALALVYAITYPKEVAGLVLLAPAAYESQDDDGFLAGLPAVPVIGDAANYVLTPLLAATVVRSNLKKAFSPDPVPPGYERTVLSEWTTPKKVKAYAQDSASLNSTLKKLSPRYSEITVPVSILTGDSDLIVSGKENAERLHAELPKSNLIVLSKTGHELPVNRSQAVVDEIEKVQRLSRNRP